MTKTKAAAIAALACLCVTAATGCGEDPSSLATGCVIADVSGSTNEARDSYASAFQSFATEIGTNGSGKVCLIVAAGDPHAEGRPLFDYVGPTEEHRDSPDYAPGEIAEEVSRVKKDLEKVLDDPNIRQGGSALVEAADVAADTLEPGDRLLILSDGLQRSPFTGPFRSIGLSAADTEVLLDRLDEAGLMADLEGVSVDAPMLLYHPGGLRKIGITAEREASIGAFWDQWAARTGAKDFDLSAAQ